MAAPSEISLTSSQHSLLSLLVRIAASISFLFCFSLVITILRNKYYRNRIYHRIMLGCAANTIVLNLTTIWGSWAVPQDRDPHVAEWITSARGTTATCSAQGFLYTLAAFVVPFYYVALSILSYAALRHKFHVKKYKWIELYIHIGVYIFPLASAFYLLSVDAYNPAILDCYIVSLPYGCGDQSSTQQQQEQQQQEQIFDNNLDNNNNNYDYDYNDYNQSYNSTSSTSTNTIPCIRGPENMGMLSRWLIGFPIGIVLLLPTFIMAIMYIQVRHFQGSLGRNIAASVAKQSILYLFALYWTYIFRFIFLFLLYKTPEQYIFSAHVLACVVEAMQGVWFSLTYYYLRSSNPTSTTTMSKRSKSSTRTTMSRSTMSKRSKSTMMILNNKKSWVSSSFLAAGNAIHGKSFPLSFKQDDTTTTTDTTNTTMTKSIDHNEDEDQQRQQQQQPQQQPQPPQKKADENNDNDCTSINNSMNSKSDDTLTKEQQAQQPQTQTQGGEGGGEPASVQQQQQNQQQQPFGQRKNGFFQKPSFSIFDGSSIDNSDSPWAQYLYDEGEDDDYQQDCGEYDDSDFVYSSS